MAKLFEEERDVVKSLTEVKGGNCSSAFFDASGGFPADEIADSSSVLKLGARIMKMAAIGSAVLGALALAGPADASTASGKIESLYARSSDQLQIVQLVGPQPAGRPACSANFSYYAIQDENSRAGQTQYAMLMSAQLAGRSVEIVGTGACTRWGDAEDIFYVRIVP